MDVVIHASPPPPLLWKCLSPDKTVHSSERCSQLTDEHKYFQMFCAIQCLFHGHLKGHHLHQSTLFPKAVCWCPLPAWLHCRCTVMQYWGGIGTSSCSALDVQMRFRVTGLNETSGVTILNVRRTSMGGKNTAVLFYHPIFCLWKWPEHFSEVLISRTWLFHSFHQNSETVNSLTYPWYFFAYLGFLEIMHFTTYILSLQDWLLWFLFVFTGT